MILECFGTTYLDCRTQDRKLGELDFVYKTNVGKVEAPGI